MICSRRRATSKSRLAVIISSETCPHSTAYWYLHMLHMACIFVCIHIYVHTCIHICVHKGHINTATFCAMYICMQT